MNLIAIPTCPLSRMAALYMYGVFLMFTNPTDNTPLVLGSWVCIITRILAGTSGYSHSMQHSRLKKLRERLFLFRNSRITNALCGCWVCRRRRLLYVVVEYFGSHHYNMVRCLVGCLCVLKYLNLCHLRFYFFPMEHLFYNSGCLDHRKAKYS